MLPETSTQTQLSRKQCISEDLFSENCSKEAILMFLLTTFQTTAFVQRQGRTEQHSRLLNAISTSAIWWYLPPLFSLTARPMRVSRLFLSINMTELGIDLITLSSISLMDLNELSCLVALSASTMFFVPVFATFFCRKIVAYFQISKRNSWWKCTN